MRSARFAQVWGSVPRLRMFAGTVLLDSSISRTAAEPQKRKTTKSNSYRATLASATNAFYTVARLKRQAA